MIPGLATSIVTSFLIPYVKEGLKKIAETVAKDAGDHVGKQISDVAKKVWDRVRSAFDAPDEKVILDQFEKRPDKTGSLIEDLLAEKLEKDKDLAKDLEQLVTSHVGTEGSTSLQVMNNSGLIGYVDARGATISGIVGGVIQGVDPSPKPKTSPSTPQ
jgi:hypothetical protein